MQRCFGKLYFAAVGVRCSTTRREAFLITGGPAGRAVSVSVVLGLWTEPDPQIASHFLVHMR